MTRDEIALTERGRVIVNTGNGKGKKTAVLGTAIRALGHGIKVRVIQVLGEKGIFGPQGY